MQRDTALGGGTEFGKGHRHLEDGRIGNCQEHRRRSRIGSSKPVYVLCPAFVKQRVSGGLPIPAAILESVDGPFPGQGQTESQPQAPRSDEGDSVHQPFAPVLPVDPSMITPGRWPSRPKTALGRRASSTIMPPSDVASRTSPSL